MARSYHRQCGRTFGGMTGFDWHLKWLDSAPWVECVDPATVGLTEVDGVWVRKAPDASVRERGERRLEATPVTSEVGCA